MASIKSQMESCVSFCNIVNSQSNLHNLLFAMVVCSLTLTFFGVPFVVFIHVINITSLGSQLLRILGKQDSLSVN